MNGFYWDMFLMVVTYGILTYLSIRLMRQRKRRIGGNNDEGGSNSLETPIFPDLPDGVIWPQEELEEELIS